MACETLYVRKHVQCARVGESEPAARGIEIHQILATYINHLVRTKRSTDLEAFDVLMKRAGAAAREVLEKFRDNHAFDPEKILDGWFRVHVEERDLREKLTISGLSSPLKAEKCAKLAENLAGVVDVRVETDLRIGRETKGDGRDRK